MPQPDHRSPACHVCGEGGLRMVQGYAAFRRVTSDCRPWPSGGALAVCRSCGAVQKPATAAWRAECRAIYGSYVVYRQGTQAEQSVFAGGSGLGEARSLVLMRWVLGALGAPPSGRALDFGCGTGSLLRSMSALAPGWALEGQDIGDRYRGDILAVPGVSAFHNAPAEALPAGFDLITAVHVVEHLEGPAGHLRLLAGKLATDGALAIEVPDLRRNAFDLLIADHATHFTRRSLAAVLAAAGLEAVASADELVPKELSTVVRRASAMPAADRDDPAEALDRVDAHLAWLDRLRATARAAADSGPIGIFGASIAATWLDAELGSSAALFVDEDPQRAGSDYMGRRIVAPREVPKDLRIVVPLTPEVAPAVAGRLEGIGLAAITA